MLLALYLTLLAGACLYAQRSPRQAWYLVVLFGVLQDPVRKLTPGTPVVISYSVVLLQAAVVLSSLKEMREGLTELRRRFPDLQIAVQLTAIALIVAAMRGLVTFGLQGWMAPALSLVTYALPLVLALYGFTWAQREEDVYRFFRFYAVIISVALIGTILEYYRVRWGVLGTVGLGRDWIRHLTGIQVRMLSGFFRGPDLMATHAATLTCVSAALAMKAGPRLRGAIWIALSGWGFLSVLLSGRRKAVYFIAAFLLVYLWRSIRHLKPSQLVAMITLIISLLIVTKQLSSREDTQVYTAAATASGAELMQRFEGGVRESFRQFGIFGAGLGVATQGTRHLVPAEQRMGWQEGGLGKLAVELGLPGLLSVALLAALLLRLTLRLTSIPDVPGCSNYVRVVLMALVFANIASFAGSAQAYTDSLLAPVAAFLGGCLVSTAVLDERVTEASARVHRVRSQAPREGINAPAAFQQSS